LVVVNCQRVDSNGVWGSLHDWGPHCSAYIPTGSVVQERGRGERRAQAAFISRARRLTSKGYPLQVVAEVEDVDTVSSSGVDQISEDSQPLQSFCVTLTRRGISDEEEADAMEKSRRIQRCARFIVDRAAARVGVSRLWARRIALFEPYRRSLLSHVGKDGTDDVRPCQAASHFLLETMGNLPDGAERDAEQHLLLSDDRRDVEKVGKGRWQRFVRVLLALCQEEQRRLSKPVVHCVEATLGGHKAIANLLARDASPNVCDISRVTSSLDHCMELQPPRGCEPLSVSMAGAGRYTFTTKAASSEAVRALSFLESAVTRANDSWEDGAETAVKSGTTTSANDASEVDTNATNDGLGRTSTSILQPSLNVGLIGDVANGKSTLIRSMTGKRTQAHSSEQREHGKTIRLGFANCAIVHCQDHVNCDVYSFLPEDEDLPRRPPPPCCRCGGAMEFSRRISFIDCPGHAELMSTMLGGASAFDAVLFAAAANLRCPTTQAKQHLDALSFSGILPRKGNVAIVQTKAELLFKPDETTKLSAAERLERHATEARKALRCTVAAGAPFFPTCAPLKLGLEPLARWLAHIPTQDKTVAVVGSNGLNVLRSFDVNHPGKSYDEVVGGVIGGTISGAGTFKTGDLLEIRPGLVVSTASTRKKKKENEEPFVVRSLECRCKGIMSGKMDLQQATSGGLIAIRTTLCPSLCAANRLVGSVVGPRGTLPPVWGPCLFLDRMSFVSIISLDHTERLDPSKSLKEGAKVRCHSGSASVLGHVVRVSRSRGKLEVHLQAPLCAHQGANAAIEAAVGEKTGAFHLVAHARVFGGTCCLEGSKIAQEEHHPVPKYTGEEKENDEKDRSDSDSDDDYDYDYGYDDTFKEEEGDEERRVRFLEELAEQKEEDHGLSSRVSVPVPDVEREGRSHVRVKNFSVIAEAFRRDPNHLLTFLAREGGLSCARAGEKGSSLRVRWRGGSFEARLSKILRRYAIAFITCRECKSARTELLRASGGHKTELLCRQCNARRFVPNLSQI